MALYILFTWMHNCVIQFSLPQIPFSFVEGAPFHEYKQKPVDKQASGPHTNTLGRENKSPI